ncbi:Sporulation protein YlmC/YmxH [Alkaliphilus metalliredigens QYMF]|uniref:Sporulation protein YlmC/YmxH n=1 Tax=Alkaliphilus metalliredigens (strain QYMF) TaxID=293826 RepID=A6TS51_ALKMQ|nr:YlmC/YmxH family sporulation protein [Alkaliphilus metalliredigens]ABR49019.1 Sporulation protein YlmC/YmxH [Alkaliphilus metalliredigens QYMF]
MIRASDLTEKEVVSITDGKKLGYISDLEVDMERGRVTAIIVPIEGRMMGLFGKEEEQEVTWGEIKHIGVDVILVEIKGPVEPRVENDDEGFYPIKAIK